MSLVGALYDDDDADGDSRKLDNDEDISRPLARSPRSGGLSLIADYGENSLSASGGSLLQDDVPQHRDGSREGRLAGPTPVDSGDPSPAAWLEKTQDFYKSPRSDSPRQLNENSPSASVSRQVSIERDSNLEPPLKKPRLDYSSWRLDFPEPVAPPDSDLVDSIAHGFDYKRAGKNINREVRMKKAFKNPDIIDVLSRQHNILEIGTNLPPEVFDPFAFPAEAFYDSLEKKQTALYHKDEEAKRMAASKGNRVVDFVAASKVGLKK